MSDSFFHVIDRRDGKGKSAENRQKFLKRVRESIRESMPDMLSRGSMKDIGKDGGDVVVKRKSIDEPQFVFGKNGEEGHVLPGNKEYTKGDRIKKPQGGQGGGGGKQAGRGEGQDDFVIQISREEFLKFFFEDLELPDLVAKELNSLEEVRYRTAGYSSSGSPARLSVVRTMRQAQARRLALGAAPRRELEELLAEIEKNRSEGIEPDEEQLKLVETLRARIARVSFIDPLDLRYRTSVVETIPVTDATMVCIMDISGSMGQREKTLARKFFYLLYLFLSNRYEKVTLYFIHHTDNAKLVDEDTFFNTRESGGTIVSTALDLLRKQMEGDINPSKTNLYVCQCSDGDNFSSDNADCSKLLDELLPYCRYWAYVQIEAEGAQVGLTELDSGRSDTLWSTFASAYSKGHANLAMRQISKDGDIYPVFRKLFEKKETKERS